MATTNTPTCKECGKPIEPKRPNAVRCVPCGITRDHDRLAARKQKRPRQSRVVR